MIIIPDTNFLLYCAKQKIDYLREISEILNGREEIIILSRVLEELKKLKLKAHKLADRDSASLALQILEKYLKEKKVKEIKSKGYADNTIRQLSKEQDTIIATLDKELKNRLQGAAGIITIFGKRSIKLI